MLQQQIFQKTKLLQQKKKIFYMSKREATSSLDYSDNIEFDNNDDIERLSVYDAALIWL